MREYHDQLRQTAEHVLGSGEYSSDKAIQKWQHLISELYRLHDLEPKLITISLIAQKIADSGAKQWAELLKNSPLLNGDDTLTPVHWYESWRWKRRAHYIREIDGREHLKKLSEDRSRLDKYLKNTFVELVRLKTYIGLHKMTERVQGALMRFVSAVKGIGKRKRNVRHAMTMPIKQCRIVVVVYLLDTPTWRE